MEYELNGQTYRIGKLDARAQFHIVRRLAPVLGELAPSIQGGKNGLEALPAIASAIAKLSDADADYCLFGLLRVVSRKQANGLGWSPVSTENLMMFDDIDMAAMLRLAWQTLSYNISGFFAALPSDLKDARPKASAQ